jgi:ABC-type branched-subunit amino acid transport system substrate-binding protein
MVAKSELQHGSPETESLSARAWCQSRPPRSCLGILGRGRAVGAGLAALGGLLVTSACSEPATRDSEDPIVVGAVLPFTGQDATIGQNLEQALLLAVEDVNRAGGVDGRKLRLESRDSNSGSARGLNALLELMYTEQIRYLVGPEENELAGEIVPDIKGLDVLNILPGYASPSIQRVGRQGAWLRLAPSTNAFGCGLAEIARETGVKSANSIVAQDDFNQNVASNFAVEFFSIGGRVLASTTVGEGSASNASRVEAALEAGADRTLLIVSPTAATTILTEWAAKSRSGAWLFGPSLRTPGFLQNVPFKSLDGTRGLSPTLSLASECEAKDEGYRGSIQCQHGNADAFSNYFAKRWDGDRPFPAAHFYYDAVVLLGMGLTYASARGEPKPSAAELRDFVLEMTNEATEPGRWDELPAVLSTLRDATPLAYAGAAAEYQFDKYGAAKHLVFDSWRIEKQDYVDQGTLQALCLWQAE